MKKTNTIKSNKLINHRDFHLNKIAENISDTSSKGELKHQFNVKSKCSPIRSVNITPDNRYLIVTNANNPKIRVIDLELLEYKPQKFNSHQASVRLTSITKDGSAFYTASWDGSSHRYEIETGKCTSIFDSSGFPMPSCYISQDEKYLFTANYESTDGLDSANRGRCRDLINNKIYEFHHKKRQQYPATMDIAYDGMYVYTGSDDGAAHKWSLKKQKSLIRFFNLPVSVRKIAVSKRYFAAACSDGVVRVYDKTSGEKYKQLIHNRSEEVLDIRIIRDESKLVSASSDGTILCFNLLSGKTIFHTKVHNNWIWSICLFNNEQQIVSGSTDGTIAFMTINGDILARYYNLTDKHFLISCPKGKDKIFPNGCFFTTNSALITVKRFDKINLTNEVLAVDDKNRLDYITKLNRKNIIISKLRNHKNYDKLSENYSKHKKLLDGLSNGKTIKFLNESCCKI